MFLSTGGSHTNRHTSNLNADVPDRFYVTATPRNFNCRCYMAVFCLKYSTSRIINLWFVWFILLLSFSWRLFLV